MFKRSLYTFLGVAGPHLGLEYNDSTLINLGLWIGLKTMRHPRNSLHQMAMKDQPDLRQTYLYDLSKQKGLLHIPFTCTCNCIFLQWYAS